MPGPFEYRKLDLACCARHKGCALFHIIVIFDQETENKKEEKMTRLERRLAQTMQILMLIANQSGRKSFLPAEIDLFNLLLFLNMVKST